MSYYTYTVLDCTVVQYGYCVRVSNIHGEMVCGRESPRITTRAQPERGCTASKARPRPVFHIRFGGSCDAVCCVVLAAQLPPYVLCMCSSMRAWHAVYGNRQDKNTLTCPYPPELALGAAV